VYKAAGDVNPVGATSARGCYQLSGVLDLIVPGGTISVPVASPNAVAAVLAPGLAVKQVVTGVDSPAPTTADVTVVGTYGYKAQVFLDLHYSPVNATGSCAGLDWSKTTVASTPAVPTEIVTDGTYRVTSGPTARIGCYAMAPRVVFVDNPNAVFTLVPANQLVVVLAGGGAHGVRRHGRPSGIPLHPAAPGCLPGVGGLVFVGRCSRAGHSGGGFPPAGATPVDAFGDATRRFGHYRAAGHRRGGRGGDGLTRHLPRTWSA